MALDDLWRLGEQVGERLRQRGETVAVAESSAGGLISAALLAVPGASAYFLGGGVIYTRTARSALLSVLEADLADIRPSTEAYALLLARASRERLQTTWAIGETGAAGPTGNRYGDAAGHACLAVVGPTEHALTVETGAADRLANMQAFALAALQLLAGCLEA
jgi:nicotinamide-nucleotide amidase